MENLRIWVSGSIDISLEIGTVQTVIDLISKRGIVSVRPMASSNAGQDRILPKVQGVLCPT